MKRLGEFFRSVIPADPAQLIYLVGLVCLTICKGMKWITPAILEITSLSPDKLPGQWSLYHSSIAGLCIFAAVAGYYSCFWPGRRPLRRLVIAVLLPASIALLVGGGRILYLTGRYYPRSILETGGSSVMSISGIPAELMKLGPGFWVLLLAVFLVLLFASRVAFGISSLPIAVSGPVNAVSEDSESDSWRRTRNLIWIFVSPMLLLLGNFLTVIWLAIPKIHAGEDFSWTADIGSAFLMVGVCLLLLKSGRSQILQLLRILKFKYLGLGIAIPILISGLFPLTFYIRNRIYWAAHDYGRSDAPHFFEGSYTPDPWLLILLVPALAEEIIFRGIVQRQLIRRYGLWRGVFLVSILWAAFHLPGDSFSSADYYVILSRLATRIFGCLALGCVFSWLTLKSASVIPAAFAHGLSNFFLFSGFGPMFEGKHYVSFSLWALLAFILFRYWPIREDVASPEVIVPIEPVPVG